MAAAAAAFATTDCIVATAGLAGAKSVGGTSGTNVVPTFNSVRTELLIRRSQPAPQAESEGEG